MSPAVAAGMAGASGDGRHVPVMLAEVIGLLAPIPGETFIDGTFGAGGYSRAILSAGASVIAIDRDPSAIAAGAALAKDSGGRLTLVARGAWTSAHAGDLERQVDLATAQVRDARVLSIDAAAVRELDTLGAWLLERLLRSANGDSKAELVRLPSHFNGLLDEVHQVNRKPAAPRPPQNRIVAALESLGRGTASVKPGAEAFLDVRFVAARDTAWCRRGDEIAVEQLALPVSRVRQGSGGRGGPRSRAALTTAERLRT